MKTQQKWAAGLIGAAACVALTAATGTAQLLTHCSSGTMAGAGAGFAYPSAIERFNPTIVTSHRTVYLTCDAGALSDTSAWDGLTARAFVVPPTPDKDGIYAAALTALVDGKKVEYYLSSAAESERVNARKYLRSWIRSLHVKE
uniref:hypothetical protein n=1 Tax=Candidatus Electronema sp. TaxID=2698783 RepID=UPI004057960E